MGASEQVRKTNFLKGLLQNIGLGLYPKKRTVKKEASCCRIELRQEVRFTPKKHTKVEILSEEVFRRKAEGEMNREIAQST